MRIQLNILLYFIGYTGFIIALVTNQPSAWVRYGNAIAQAQRHWIVAQDLCEAAQDKILEQYGLFDWPQDCETLEWL